MKPGAMDVEGLLILLSQKVAANGGQNHQHDSHFRWEAGMALPRSNDGEARFSAYVEGLTSVIGHADRAKPCTAARF